MEKAKRARKTFVQVLTGRLVKKYEGKVPEATLNDAISGLEKILVTLNAARKVQARKARKINKELQKFSTEQLMGELASRKK